MRLFLGIDLPSEIKKYVEAKILPAKTSDKGWESAHDYHQTLLFIGESSDEQLAEIKRRLKTLEFHSFYLELGEVKFFPRRVMYLSFHPSDALLTLRDLIMEIYPEWKRVGERPFTPHVTLKRYQRYEQPDLVKELSKVEIGPKQFPVKELCLFKSQKDELNRKYHVIDRKVFKV